MQNGCFLSEDTVAGDQINPLSLNRYAYVSNNPVNYADPSGHVATSRFSQTMKIDGGGGSSSTSKKNGANVVLQQDTLPSTTQGYQSAESRLTAAAKEMEGFKEAAKEAEADGAKPIAEKEDKVASEDADWVNELADTVKEGMNDIGKSVCDYAGTEEGQTTIAAIIACIVAVILTVVVAPYALAALGVAATSLTGYMAIMGIAGASYFGTYEYAKSSLDQDPAWETALETIQGASEGGLLGMFVGATMYGVHWLWETVADLLMNQGGEETEEWWNVEQEGGSKTTKELMSESDSALKWGVLDDGTNQGVKHFNEYWDKYPERIPSLEKRLGLPEGTFDNTLDGFNNFTEQAERVVREATEIGNVRNINGKSIYYIDGIENAKKGVVVIMKDGKIQTMMPSDFKSFNKMQ